MLLIASPQHEMNMITSTVINLTIDLQISCDMGEFSHFLSLPYINGEKRGFYLLSRGVPNIRWKIPDS